MVTHHLRTALKSLRKNRSFALINIFGLAVGFGAVLVIALYVRDQMSFNRHFEGHASIYQLFNLTDLGGGRVGYGENAPGIMKAHIHAAFPEFQAVVRAKTIRRIASAGNNRFFQGVTHVDAGFADIFTLDYMDPRGANRLSNPSSVLLSEDASVRLFGTAESVGETITIDNKNTYTVSGVFRSLPENSVLSGIEIVVPIDEDALAGWPGLIRHWGANQWRTFARLKSGTNLPEDTALRLEQVIDAHLPNFQPGFDKTSDYKALSLIPLAETRFYEPFPDASPNLNWIAVVSFSSIALAILLIAGINFVNMSVSLAARRTLEVAIRKTLGANRKQIIYQYLAESITLAAISFLVGLTLVEVLLPAFNQMMGMDLSLDPMRDSLFLALMGALALVFGSLGGMYPALLVSRYRPGNVLKSNKSKVGSRPWVRMSLIVLQYSMSMVLIILASVIYLQTNFALSTSKGFEESGQIVLSQIDQEGVLGQSSVLRERLSALPGVTAAARSLNVPGENIVNGSVLVHDREGSREEVYIKTLTSDPEFVPTFGLKLLAGRRLDRNRATDNSATMGANGGDDGKVRLGVLVDMTLVKAIGFNQAEDAIGHLFEFNNGMNAEIVGVVDALMFQSMRARPTPIVLYYNENFAQRLSIRFDARPVTDMVADIERVWTEIYPNIPMELSFLDERLARSYETDLRTANLILVFAFLAVVIASLGLYAQAGLEMVNRTREIVLRKIMGAGVSNIGRLLLLQFSKPVLLALLPAWIIAYLLADLYLSDFTASISVPLAAFAAAGLITLVIAWLTVSGHLMHMIRLSPVAGLRDN